MNSYPINRAHGIMYHHFHNEVHPVGQGSISAEDFEKTLLFIGPQNILSAKNWLYNFDLKTPINNKVCITFDDSLKCQYEIAKPVLDKYQIKAFFFVYSSVLRGATEYLEVFRYFRSKYFNSFDDFFLAFMRKLDSTTYKSEVSTALAKFDPTVYLENFEFYSVNDKIFRFTRDHILKVDRYNEVVLDLMKDYDVSIADVVNFLWMNTNQIKQLHEEGHVIGLHSDTHPTTMGLFKSDQQRSEYTKNKKFLESIISTPIDCMSHPCNSYNGETIKILEDLQIKIGFRANMQTGFDSNYEIPREDHINVYKLMKEAKI